jgi:hypothetical protein
MWQRILPFVALAGCSSDSSPSAIHGTIRGSAYPVAAAISATVTSFGKSAAFIILSSSTDLCLPADAQIQHPGEKTVVIVLEDNDAAPTGPGTYTVVDPAGNGPPPTRAALLYSSVLDPACLNHADDQTTAISGTVMLTSVSGGAYAGQFDVTLDSGDHVTGSFRPTACDELPAELQSSSTPACKP